MMAKFKLFPLVQFIWQILFFLSISIWKDIPKIPAWATRDEILEETRWFWLMNAPKSTIENSSLIASIVFSLSIIQLIGCLIYIFIYLIGCLNNSTKTKIVLCLTLILLAILCSLLFELQMHNRFINMTGYYFLWNSLVTTEIFSIVSLLLYCCAVLF